MSKIAYAQYAEEEVGLLDGLDFASKAKLAAGLSFLMLFAFVVLGLFWWVLRLLYIYEEPHWTVKYTQRLGLEGVDVRKEKLHAILSGMSLAAACTGSVGIFFNIPKMPAIACIATTVYVFLTIVHLQKANEDPVAYGWG